MTTAALDTLRELRAARRRRRLADIHWIDALYRVYASVFGIGTLVWWVASLLGERDAAPAGQAQVAADGPALVGLGVAVVLGLAVRSGLRGGPLAVEAADVVHVLQAPVDRRRALLRPFVHQLRRGAGLGLATGAIAGQLAAPFLPSSAAAWTLLAGVVGAGLGLAWMGAASVVSGARVSKPVAGAAGLALLAWSGVDIAAGAITSPCSLIGGLAVEPVRGHRVAPAVGAAVLAALVVALLAGGLATLGGVALERVERRSALVGQLRFAVSTQDLRAVLLLRRQLSAEHPRRRPWFRVQGRPGPSAAVHVRSLRSVARWPVSRIARVTIAAVAAGLAGRAAWEGALPLVAVAGVAGFVAGLDAIEPMSQDADHPEVLAMLPRHRGRVANRQLIVPTVVLALFGLVAAAVAVVSGPLFDAGLGDAALIGGAVAIGVAAAIAGVLAAAASVAMGPPSLATMLTTPEVALARTMLAPGLAVLAVALPVLLARWHGETGKGPGLQGGIIVTALFGWLVVAWLTNGGVRDQSRG